MSPPPVPAYGSSSPPGPPSPPGWLSPQPYVGTTSFDTYGGESEDKEEENEAFPVTFNTASLNLSHQPSAFNASETSKAFSAFFDEDNSGDEDEDEPLPTKVKPQVDPNHVHHVHLKTEHEDEPEEDEPLPITSVKIEDEHTGEQLGLANDVNVVRDLKMDDDDEPEINEPFLIAKDISEPKIKAEPDSSISTDSTVIKSDDVIMDTVPQSPPPRPLSPASPPSSPPPPPPPPMSPPPLVSVAHTDQDVIKDEVKPLQPILSHESEENTSDDEKPKAPAQPIDYTNWHQYRMIAQQINACLERLCDVRYFAMRSPKASH